MKANSEKQNRLTSSQSSQIALPPQAPPSALVSICVWRQRYKNILLGKMGGDRREKGEREDQRKGMGESIKGRKDKREKEKERIENSKK